MGKFKMKGFRNSPFTAEDYDNLTEDEKIALIDRASEDKKEEESKKERLKIHNPQIERERGSAY
tara:strand:+ start:741 stop:932 length:192 start_codon:yes stop_codon:yes gene_type:complete